MVNDRLIEKVIELRSIEETLLEQFQLGRVSGTVHTSIGQEITPVILNNYITEDDWVFSNHRGHSHFLAQFDLVSAVISEIMGKKSGLCSGYGGSQHLQHKKFYSNGIQGGMTPIACGASFSEKLAETNNIAIIFIGDGTLGQGILYESLNIAGWMDLPILFILEDNGIAQSTSTDTFNYTNLEKCVEGFNLSYFEGDTDDWSGLDKVMSNAVQSARGMNPTFVRIKTRRLMSHSKGDDNRNDEVIESHHANDPLNKLLNDSKAHAEYRTKYKLFLSDLCDEIITQEPLEDVEKNSIFLRGGSSIEKISVNSTLTVREKIHNSLRKTLDEYPKAIVIGEDIRNRSLGADKDYGGAFKVTGNLSDTFEDRVINFPIAEQSIIGFGIGYALSGNPAICEIMFGDFTTLIVDQVYQHATKFTKMYGNKINLPLIIRTPMGGGRGYGPTHSQSLEKLFIGCDGLQIISVNSFVDSDTTYKNLIKDGRPSLIFENKIGYNSTPDIYDGFNIYAAKEQYPTILISNGDMPDISFIAHGANADLVIEALKLTNNLNFELICPVSLSALNLDLVIKSVSKSKKLIVVEEGTIIGSPGSALTNELLKFGVSIDFFDYVSNETVIPASHIAEKKLLPSIQKILNSIQSGMNYDY